jgi:nitrate reductase delta subunit
MNHSYGDIADLIEYPDGDWSARLAACRPRLEAERADSLSGLIGFLTEVDGLSLHALQELYTDTFDLNPVCTLDAGYHLFGEDYKRGLLLANLRETESAYQLGQNAQLPDHLPVLLRLIDKLDDAEVRDDLIRLVLLPAVEKMARVLDQTTNPYRRVIGVIAAELLLEVPDYRPAAGSVQVPSEYAGVELHSIAPRSSNKALRRY